MKLLSKAASFFRKWFCLQLLFSWLFVHNLRIIYRYVDLILHNLVNTPILPEKREHDLVIMN